MKVDLNMFHARMIDWVKTEMCGSEVITKQLGDSVTGNASSLRRVDNHIVLEAALARARYSASVVDRATTRCFLELQEMGLEPKKLI